MGEALACGIFAVARVGSGPGAVGVGAKLRGCAVRWKISGCGRDRDENKRTNSDRGNTAKDPSGSTGWPPISPHTRRDLGRVNNQQKQCGLTQHRSGRGRYS